MKACALIEVGLGGNLFETVGDSDFGIAGEETSGGGLACAWLAHDEKVVISYLGLHQKL